MFNIDEELKKLPDKPGVYLMKGENGQIIYVGKAVNLKKRVRQYFQASSSKVPKVKAMVKSIAEFEYIITDNEIEALILECNLIKKHKPKYNILLRDDKQYPYIKVTTNEKYPRVIKVRKIEKDKAKYFGPYTSASAVNDTLEIIRNIYPLRNCRKNLDSIKKKERPCLNYFIGKCLGPCQGNVNEEKYMEMVHEVLLFLGGKEDKLMHLIEEKMKNAAKQLDFENAAKYRDQLNSIKHILEKQKIVSSTLIDQDIIGMARGIEDVCIQVFFVRGGKLVGREHFILTDISETTRSEILSSFVKQFYMNSSFIPKEILIETNIQDEELISRWLSQKRGSKVQIKVPVRGEKNLLMEMVRKNAMETLENQSEKIKRKIQLGRAALDELANLLGLDKIPERIEAFDISNIQGVESVGSMVVFQEGQPKKSDYRRFKIKSVSGPNDYKSMEEIIYRRFERGMKEREVMKENEMDLGNFSIFPDLVMVDGGKGQVNAAKKAIMQFNLNIPVCGLIKDDFHRTRGIIYENKEINISKNSNCFKLITRIQDEAHRFAISYHRSLRNKKLFSSQLDSVKGIGEKRKKALLKFFGSIEKIKNASIEELKSVDGMNIKAAEAVYNYFRKLKE
ncbi:excinuclease ABC subunit C [Caloranaerobacter azorensis H53214]|uniref:UvrABC system protein C n=1 Tax=Caloranaerobacter azorensis H53214 TaxID=1156417 RepID=A0A096CVV8_9FIRM|nr:excinuclease ABC subunit UvrC [Caloranaerobacter azorensis]KGG80684.1 excinuclease ABC subunit C [Caloranaerobacter azorensis H53214]